MINEHERVVLKKPVPAEGLEAGDVGTVVYLYRDGLACEVEFTTLPSWESRMISLGLGARLAGLELHIRMVTSGLAHTLQMRFALYGSKIRINKSPRLGYLRTAQANHRHHRGWYA